LEATSSIGKKIILHTVPGVQTPEWVYQAGAKPFNFTNRNLLNGKFYNESLNIPVPWDEVYMAKWERFIQGLGRRYNRNPHIYGVVMAGGGWLDEMNLPKAHEEWKRIGYSDEKLIAVWKRLIDTYRKAFPDTPTILSINEPLGQRRSNVLKPVVSYVLETYPQKVYLQENSLRADLPKGDLIRQIIREASARTVVGYQMTGGKGFLDKETGDRLTAFRNALEDHVSYIEIYATDVTDPNQRTALHFLARPKEGQR
jgi:hypothetical protein